MAVLGSIPAYAQGQDAPNCKTIATPPPLATFGGPGTEPNGDTQFGLRVGGYAELFPSPCDHGGASDWLVRLRHGVSDRIDLGFDILTAVRGGGGIGATAKLAMRYQVKPGFRLEGGVGGSDTGFAGHSLNGDLAAVIGTANSDTNWNYYASLRLAGSYGFGDNPNAFLPLGAIGTTGRVSDNVHVVLEAGLGGIFAPEHPNPGLYVHLLFGALLDVRRER